MQKIIVEVIVAIGLILTCSCTPVTSNEDEGGAPSGEEAGAQSDVASITNGQDAGLDAAFGEGEDAGVDASNDSSVSEDAAVIDGSTFDVNAPPPPVVDASTPDDAYDGITCANPNWTWGATSVTGCAGVKTPMSSLWYLETASYQCPADGSGYGTCVKGATCAIAMVTDGEPTQYVPGTCQ